MLTSIIRRNGYLLRTEWGGASITGQTWNTLLRFGSLGAKLALTLYIGRYLGLDEMGVYGLVTASVAILVTVLGVRFDYNVLRDIVDAPPREVVRRMRDEFVFYALNYLALIAAVGLALPFLLQKTSPEIIFFTALLSILESFAAITSANFISLKQPILANILFFIRAASWAVPVMVLGVLFPQYRTVEMILGWWAAGVFASLVVTFVAWRHLPWAAALRSRIDWASMKDGARKCFLIWLGVIGSTVATYVDRFVVEHYLTMSFVGIASFYTSFTVAIQALLQSGVFAFSQPQLISHHRRKDHRNFKREVLRMTVQSTLFAGATSVAVGIGVPVLGHMFHRPEFATYAPVLWLMLLAVWLRSMTESLYYVLYARHQDRLVWITGLLVLIPAFGGNLLFVPWTGFSGIGYSAIVTSILLGVWRLYCVFGVHHRDGK